MRSICSLTRRVGPERACAWALSPYVRCMSTGSDQRRNGRKQSNFWYKWRERSQQQFWQDVVLNNDKRYERRQVPLMANKPASMDDEVDNYDDFQLQDSLAMEGLMDEFDSDYDDENNMSELKGNSKRVDTVSELRDSVQQTDNIDMRRRAELLGLIDELGPNAFTFADSTKSLPQQSESDLTEQMMGKERQIGSLAVCSTFLSSVQLRQTNKLGNGQFFAHVLLTRRTSKVTHQGKKLSISVLAVVGNGEGVAGFGLGKDADANMALFKAIRVAKKHLVFVDRFDSRTVFHDMEEKYKCTKLVVRVRRAGAGTRCNWCIWKILNAFGITDVSVKIHGSTNNLYQTHAFFNAVQRMTTAQMIADRRGMRVLDMTPRSPSGKAGHTAD